MAQNRLYVQPELAFLNPCERANLIHRQGRATWHFAVEGTARRRSTPFYSSPSPYICINIKLHLTVWTLSRVAKTLFNCDLEPLSVCPVASGSGTWPTVASLMANRWTHTTPSKSEIIVDLPFLSPFPNLIRNSLILWRL